MTDRIKMTVDMEVTVPQALALQAMFEHWNKLGAWGASRHISFFVDGDGNFQPNCKFKFSEEIPELTPTLATLAIANQKSDELEAKFDFDAIAWYLREQQE